MRIVSGMRPTGKLHIGHLLGALKNWKELQNSNECYFFVADWHAFTTDYDKTAELPTNIREMVVDWLATGIDPNKSTLFVQSKIPEHAELFLLLSMVTPITWLERNPTFKELKEELKEKDLSNLGFLAYPVLQAADIALYKGEAVPVGHDQLPHLELTREIVRRFNHIYKSFFPEPKSLLTPTPRVNGTDGRKMSKSYGNAIYLSDDEKTVKKKIQGMVTDPQRVRREDPGNPDQCNLYPLHEAFSPKPMIGDVRKGCTTAGIGCVDCKQMLMSSLLPLLHEIREKRDIAPKEVEDVLRSGAERARDVAQKTMKEVRKVLSLDSL